MTIEKIIEDFEKGEGWKFTYVPYGYGWKKGNVLLGSVQSDYFIRVIQDDVETLFLEAKHVIMLKEAILQKAKNETEDTVHQLREHTKELLSKVQL